MSTPSFRTEQDSLGSMEIPSDAYYGIQTARALENFPVSGLHADPSLIRAYGRIKGAAAIHSKNGLNWFSSFIELTHRNTRRYGGYLVHMGIVLMFVGFSGAAFNKDRTVEVVLGDSFKIGRYDLKVASLREGDNENYTWNHAVIQVFRGGSQVDTLEPERRFYKSSRQSTSEVAIRRRLNEDLYLNFAGLTEDGLPLQSSSAIRLSPLACAAQHDAAFMGSLEGFRGVRAPPLLSRSLGSTRFKPPWGPGRPGPAAKKSGRRSTWSHPVNVPTCEWRPAVARPLAVTA